jgi:hypothetical protein
LNGTGIRLDRAAPFLQHPPSLFTTKCPFCVVTFDSQQQAQKHVEVEREKFELVFTESVRRAQF